MSVKWVNIVCERSPWVAVFFVCPTWCKSKGKNLKILASPLSRYVSSMTENFSLGTLDTVLFTLVILTTAGAGTFQGWLESSSSVTTQDGLALPKGRGPFVDVLYRVTVTTSLPLLLGKWIFRIFSRGFLLQLFDYLSNKCNLLSMYTVISVAYYLFSKIIFPQKSLSPSVPPT